MTSMLPIMEIIRVQSVLLTFKIFARRADFYRRARRSLGRNQKIEQKETKETKEIVPTLFPSFPSVKNFLSRKQVFTHLQCKAGQAFHFANLAIFCSKIWSENKILNVCSAEDTEFR